MRKISSVLLIALLGITSLQVNAAPEKIGNFGLIDHLGNFHQLRKYGDSKAVVIISTSASCLENIEKLPKYRLLRTTWERQGITFLAINASAEDSLDDVRQMDALHNFDLPILFDESQLVAESLGLSKAGELIVLDPPKISVSLCSSLGV